MNVFGPCWASGGLRRLPVISGDPEHADVQSLILLLPQTSRGRETNHDMRFLVVYFRNFAIRPETRKKQTRGEKSVLRTGSRIQGPRRQTKTIHRRYGVSSSLSCLNFLPICCVADESETHAKQRPLTTSTVFTVPPKKISPPLPRAIWVARECLECLCAASASSPVARAPLWDPSALSIVLKIGRAMMRRARMRRFLEVFPGSPGGSRGGSWSSVGVPGGSRSRRREEGGGGLAGRREEGGRKEEGRKEEGRKEGRREEEGGMGEDGGLSEKPCGRSPTLKGDPEEGPGKAADS